MKATPMFPEIPDWAKRQIEAIPAKSEDPVYASLCILLENWNVYDDAIDRTVWLALFPKEQDENVILRFSEILESAKKLTEDQRNQLAKSTPMLNNRQYDIVYQAILKQRQFLGASDRKAYIGDFVQAILDEIRSGSMREDSEHLHKILQDDNLHLFKAYLEEGSFELEMKTYHEDTLFHAAAKANAIRILGYLISEVPTWIEEDNRYHETPLFSAAIAGSQEAFDLLMSRGANPNRLCERNATPLSAVVYSENIQFLDHLLDDYHIEGERLIHPDLLLDAMEDERIEGIVHLLRKGVLEITKPYDHGRTLFTMALTANNPMFATRLLNEFHYPKDLPDEIGYFPIHAAIEFDQVDLFQQLLGEGYEDMTMYGETMLEVSIIHHAKACFPLLYARNGHRFDDLTRATWFASKTAFVEVLRELKKHDATFTLFANQTSPIVEMMRNDRSSMVLEFLDMTDVETHNMEKIPLLIDPTFHQDMEVVSKLLDMGADPNIPVIYGKKSFYPLMNAIFHDNLPMVKLLTNHGADVNLKTIDGWRALDVAITEHVSEVLLEYLRDLGAKRSFWKIAKIKPILGLIFVILLGLIYLYQLFLA
ncbi:MAG: ankyrin repeat domain-containing protein [Candidatus Izemoplasmatales bacterium]